MRAPDGWILESCAGSPRRISGASLKVLVPVRDLWAWEFSIAWKAATRTRFGWSRINGHPMGGVVESWAQLLYWADSGYRLCPAPFVSRKQILGNNGEPASVTRSNSSGWSHVQCILTLPWWSASLSAVSNRQANCGDYSEECIDQSIRGYLFWYLLGPSSSLELYDAR